MWHIRVGIGYGIYNTHFIVCSVTSKHKHLSKWERSPNLVREKNSCPVSQRDMPFLNPTEKYLSVGKNVKNIQIITQLSTTLKITNKTIV